MIRQTDDIRNVAGWDSAFSVKMVGAEYFANNIHVKKLLDRLYCLRVE